MKGCQVKEQFTEVITSGGIITDRSHSCSSARKVTWATARKNEDPKTNKQQQKEKTENDCHNS